MRYFDLHCDTPYRMYHEQLDFDSPHLQVNDHALQQFESPRQVFAVWSDKHLDDQRAFEAYGAILANFKQKIRHFSVTPYFAVEDARLLCGQLSRLYELHRDGVRFLTLVWGGTSPIGGAHDTGQGLTAFGIRVVQRCFELGVVPDISHASKETAEQVLTLAEEAHRPVVASHSNAYSLCRHPRNLTDEQFRRICAGGGLVGLSLVPEHLSGTGLAFLSDAVRHVRHWLSLGGEAHLCLGCDFDGIAHGPVGLEDAGRLPALADALRAVGVSPDTIEQIFWKNAARFAEAHLQ
ncbi:MAG: membrane dipeptidase [Eubacteriales bacterium]